MIRARSSHIKAAQRLSARALSSTYAGNNVLGILREDFGMWERRAPLSPNQVGELLKTNPGVKVLVQPCTRRVFSNVEYEKAGATITEDLKEASFLIGVKSPKANSLIPDKSYMFFSHTIKAQPYSMPLLDTILQKNIRLYDYECITHGGRDDTPRSVAFGGYAGRAGMIDGLQGLGLRLLAEGFSTPFLHLPTTYMHQNWAQAQEAVRKMGDLITKNGLPKQLTPLVFAFTGKGNVAKGAKEVFEHLPHEYITVKELAGLKADVEAGRRPANKVYGVLVETSDIAQLKGQPDAPFDRQDFTQNPSKYEGKFHRTVLPHIHMLVNGVYWDDRYPRVVTKQQIAHLRSAAGGNNRNLRMVADISCDYQGSVEFLERFTTIEDPYFTYNPEAASSKDASKPAVTSTIDGSGILVLGVDNLPSELPRDASEHFGAALLPLIPPVLQSKGDAEMADLPAELRRACLFSGGDYRPKWNYIARLREQAEHTKAAQLAASRGKNMARMKIELVVRVEGCSVVLLFCCHVVLCVEFVCILVGGSTVFSQPCSLEPSRHYLCTLWVCFTNTFDVVLVPLQGHLFDTGLINQVLDLLEASSKEVPFTVSNCDVRPNNSSGAQYSRVALELTSEGMRGAVCRVLWVRLL
jgi:alpha-aminoadipic semialdehyde synthase